MKLTMARNSIFSILLRSPWWMSAAIAALLFAVAIAIATPASSAVLTFAALPFVAIAAIAAWKQRYLPSRVRIERTEAALQAMSWSTFAGVLEEGFRDDGCTVTRLNSGPCDFELRRKNRLAAVSAKRWKASRVGVQALRELAAAREARGAQEAIYVTTGEISAQAAEYARANDIQFLTASELARLLPRISRGK